MTAINQAVFAFAPAIFGVLHDLNTNYAAAFVLAAVAPRTATIVLRRPKMSPARRISGTTAVA